MDPADVILARIETKVDLLLQQMADHESRLRIQEARPKYFEDHEARLRILERQIWFWSGGAALLGTLLSLITSGVLHSFGVM